MKSTLSLFLSSTLVLGTASATIAQAQDDGRLQQMREHLGLSEEQVTKLKAVFDEDAPKMKALRDDATLSEAQKRDQMKELSAARREKIGAILTPDQKAKFAEELKKRGGERGGGPGQPPPDGGRRFDELKDKLGLSAAQVEKLKPIMAEEGPKMRALRDDPNATPESKREAMKQSMDRITAELTPEQVEKFKEDMRNRKKPSAQ